MLVASSALESYASEREDSKKTSVGARSHVESHYFPCAEREPHANREDAKPHPDLSSTSLLCPLEATSAPVAETWH